MTIFLEITIFIKIAIFFEPYDFKDITIILFFSDYGIFLLFLIKDTLAILNFDKNSEIFVHKDHYHITIFVEIQMTTVSLEFLK